MKKKVLFIGNIPTKDNRSIGGVSSLNYNLLSYLLKKDKNIKFYPLRKNWKPKFQLLDYIQFLLKFPFIIYRYGIISLHTTGDFRLTFGPFIILISKIFRKKTVCHFYGGYFHKSYTKYPEIIKSWLRYTILNANLVLLETKEQVNFFESKLKSNNIIWFPNARKKQNIQFSDNFSKKFVFISRVTPEKGVKLLVDVMGHLSKDYSLDIYGPLEESKDLNKSFFERKNVSYKGVLKPNDVIPTLLMYDVLVLPTLHVNEGYPGIIIEALSCGKPVITSRLVSLSEIIENEKEGILIDQGDKNQLIEAINFFNSENYKIFSKNGLTKFELFNQEHVFQKLLDFYSNN